MLGSLNGESFFECWALLTEGVSQNAGLLMGTVKCQDNVFRPCSYAEHTTPYSYAGADIVVCVATLMTSKGTLIDTFRNP